MFKPDGGLWTSTWETAFEDGWPWWTRCEDFLVRDSGWLLEPGEARVITVAGPADALELENEYGVEWGPDDFARMHSILLDWAAIARDADAVRVTNPYHPDLRFGSMSGRVRSSITWHSWDCESTWWARWCFDGRPQYVPLDRSQREEAESRRT